MQPIDPRGGSSNNQLTKLIGAVYDGVLEDPPWATMLTELRAALSATFTALIVRLPVDGALARVVDAGPNGIGFSHESLRTEQALSIDPMINLPPMRMMTMDEIMGGDAWLSSQGYQMISAIEPNGVRYCMGANIYTSEGLSGRLRVCRGFTDRDFDAGDKGFGELLLPHLQRSFEMHLRLTARESESRLYNSAVDRMLVGAITFDMDGKILRTNEVASAILHEHDGLDLVHGRLRAHYVEEDRRLQGLIRHALAEARAGKPAAEQTLAITRPTGMARISVVVRSSPIGEWSLAQHQSAVLVLLRDPGMRSEVSSRAMCNGYGLTTAEAHLCIQLIEGLTLDEAAARLGIRKNTARAHLRAIFSKTHVTRQSALVSLLMAGTRGF